MPLLALLEQKLGRFAIPNLIRMIAALQALNWCLINFVSDEFANALIFDPERIFFHGQVWRLASYVLLPGGKHIIWLLTIPFLWMINDGLEQAWGSFRLNLFLFFGMFCVAVGGLVSPMPSTGWVLWATLLFAFAVYFPDQEILLFFILPIKIKWLAWLTAAGLGFTFLGAPAELRWHLIFGLLSFLVTFGPGFMKWMKHRGQVAERRNRFEAATQPEAAHFHQCAVCGKTEVDDPALDFRITAAGDEICNKCRAAKA